VKKNFAGSIVAKLRSHVACELDSALSWKAEYQQGTSPFTVGASDETSSDFELLIPSLLPPAHVHDDADYISRC